MNDKICLSVENDEEIIWVCWFQGMEKAPDIVKICYRELLLKANRPVRLITEENFSEYVDLPNYIVCKYREGIIDRTHFSDILRTALIYQHGGLWIDSTMLLTKSIPEYIWEASIFVFKLRPPTFTWQCCSNQFIRARAGDKILGRTLCGLYAYWKINNHMISYFFYHYIFAEAVRMSNDTHIAFDNIITMYSQDNHEMQSSLWNKFDKTQWDLLLNKSFVHKLTYKNLRDTNSKDTVYWHIIHELE